MLKILIVDDHAIFRQGVKQVITEAFEDADIKEASTGEEALDAIQTAAWDVVILDINLPDKPGLEVLKEALAIRPALLILVLSMYSEDQYAVRVVKAGAMGYLTKDAVSDTLVVAIRRILGGGKYISPSLAERLADQLAGKSTLSPDQILSDRELEVLCLIARGKTVTDIADELTISVKTVSTYRARLLEKVSLKTTAELIRYALDHQLVE